jgi:Lar family restriction alleviation protein
MTAPTNLKPCPFCGGRAELDTPRGPLNRDRAIYCHDCNATMGGDSSDEVIAAWNRRASDAELPVGEPEVCKWMEDDPWGVMPGTYASQCGEMWSFIDGGPTENHVRYCHGCGKPVRVVPFPVEPEEEEVGSGERGE